MNITFLPGSYKVLILENQGTSEVSLSGKAPCDETLHLCSGLFEEVRGSQLVSVEASDSIPGKVLWP